MASPTALTVVNPSTTMPSSARLPTVYQIDFTAVASGKRIASTKRRVRWRFGFANPDALANGETGTACRGEEHDITLVWSVTSGKRLVLADGQEVHYSNSRSGVLDFSWTMRGNHVLKVVAHASPPLSPTPGFRQYDFFVDGQSFFTFPKVFKLGLSANDPRAVGSPGSPPALAQRSQPYNNYALPPGQGPRRRSTDLAVIEAPHNADEEEAYLKEAIKLSLEEGGPPVSTRSLTSGMSRRTSEPAGEPNLLLDFEAPAAAPTPALPAPVPATAPFPATSTNGYGYASQPVAPLPALPPPPSTVAEPSFGLASQPAAPQPAITDLSAGYPAPAAPTYDNAPVGVSPAPQGQFPPQQAGVAAPGSQFVSPPPQPAFTSPEPSMGFASPSGNQFAAQAPAPDIASPVPAPAAVDPWGAQKNTAPEPTLQPEPARADPAALTMSSLSGQTGSLVQDTGGTGSMADQAFMKLANLGDFDLVSKKESPRANPFDNAASSTVGGQASLADMQAQKQGTPKQDIMRSPPAPAGAMVVSSTQQGNFGGYGQYGAAPMNQPGQGLGQQPPYGGAQMNQPASYGQPSYGAPQQYGQPAQPTMQQPQFGQQQMQPPQYGQQPPMQQPQYGQQQMQPGYGAPTYQQGY